MRALVISLLMLAPNAFAAPKAYEVDVAIERGTLRKQLKLKVPVGEKSKIETQVDNDGTFMEVLATEETINGTKGIMLNMAVGTIDKNGERVIHSRPQIFTHENRTAEVSVSHEDGTEDLSLLVKAQPASDIR